MNYDVESHWSRVAGEIRNRTAGDFVAGDDDPFLRYKRDKFSRRFLPTIDVEGKRALELGCGPGGNLRALARRHPKQLIGVDISEPMLALAAENLRGCGVALKKTDGERLPLPDQGVDLAYTVTVLQHNVEPAQLSRTVAELCRVTTDRIVLMEDIGTMTAAPPGGSYVTRPVEFYREELASHGFHLVDVKPLGLRCSRLIHRIVRRLFLRRSHREGEPVGAFSKWLLMGSLPVTKLLDRMVPDNTDLTMMVFNKAAERHH
jgi:SAM-dependent methyltransferase